MTKDKALEILEQIEENVNVCCAITMDPDEVLELIDKLKLFKIMKHFIEHLTECAERRTNINHLLLILIIYVSYEIYTLRNLRKGK